MLVLEFYPDVLANTILSNNFAFGCTVFTGQGFIETVLHDIAELVQLRAIVCNRIIITESPHLTIVLV